MAKVDTDAQAQAVQTLLGGLSLKRKQELIEREGRLRMQFLQTQKIAALKAREPQVNAFLMGVVTGDRKMRDLVFTAWLKDNATPLGDIPELPARFKRDAEPVDEEGLEADIKEATALLKKWVKASDIDLVGVYARLGPYEFPAKVLTAVKKPKPKEAPASEAAEAPEAAASMASGVSEAALAELRAELEAEKAKLEAKLAKQEEETEKFKRLLEENKDRRKSELSEAQDKARAELTAKQADWQRQEIAFKNKISDLEKARQEQADKTSKVRDEMLPLKQQIERLEKEAKRAQNQASGASDEAEKLAAERAELEAQISQLQARVAELEGARSELASKEKQLARVEKKGAAVALTSMDNLKIWEEAQQEAEVKEAFKKTFSLENLPVGQSAFDERDLSITWKQLLESERELVERFFAIPFSDLTHPSDEFRELVTSFIELKDSLVAREQLSLLINYVGNKFLAGFKQKV